MKLLDGDEGESSLVRMPLKEKETSSHGESLLS